MAQVLPIEDAYIDSVIISQGPFNPNMNKTQGVKMRELIKLLRDRLRQEITENLLINQVELQNKADLVNGVIPASQLPGYVDDVLEFENIELLPYPGESGKIYITTDSNQTYRWSGTIYVTIGHDIALGETPNTAYRGDRGRVAFDHSQIVTGNPHGTSKTDLGLGNVDNTSDLNKPVSTPQANAINLKLTASVATDAETQISTIVLEDNKVITRLKLFNWWNWIRTEALTLSNKLTLAIGTTLIPPLVIPRGTVTTVLQDGAIERDSNGALWYTNLGIRRNLVIDDGNLIKMIFNYPSITQNDLTGYISSVKTISASSLYLKNKLTNIGFFRLNSIDEVYYFSGQSTGTILPTETKTEVFLKIDNGLFCTGWQGEGAVDKVKILEFSGADNNGYKSNQIPLITQVQNPDVLLAQWSTFSFISVKENNGIISKINSQYFLRDALNSRAFGAAEAKFHFEFVNTVVFADANNENGNNCNKMVRINNYALYIEQIK